MTFFDPDTAPLFVPGSTSHIVAVVGIAFTWILVPYYYKKHASQRANVAFRWTMAVVLVAQYLAWMLWEYLVGRFSLHMSLPLNLCDFSIIPITWLLVTKNYKVFEIVYFWALGGTIQSYITPNMHFGFPHLEFWCFYFQHGGEILIVLYFVFVVGYRPQAISVVKSYLWLLALILSVYVFNLVTGANYMFLMADTPHPSTITKMIELFGEPPRHMIGLGIVGALTMVILYIPWIIKDQIAKGRQPAK